jgi:ribokinase
MLTQMHLLNPLNPKEFTMSQIISIGGATQDVFVRSDGAEVIRVSNRHQEKAWLGFDYGAKIAVDALRFTVGGGATNTAVAFAHLGLEAGCMVKVANDSAGENVAFVLDAAGVNTDYLVKSEQGQTGYSVILTSYEGERSILAYRGVNTELCFEELNQEAIAAASWIYVSSLSGEADKLLEPLFAFASAHNTRIAFNPGATQLRSPTERIHALLKDVDLLFLNKEEAAKLTGLSLTKPLAEHLRPTTQTVRPAYMYDLTPLLKSLKTHIHGTVVITDGSRGTQAYDGQTLSIMPVYPTQVSDVLGAGDAFGAACTAAHILGCDLGEALCWGTANASGVVTDPGAHYGLMTRGEIASKCQQNPTIRPIQIPINAEHSAIQT